MDLLKYFKQKGLPNPRGLLSTSISPLAIVSANREVEEEIKKTKEKKCGPYKKHGSSSPITASQMLM